MRVLIVGGGGREHALAWRLKRDDPTLELLAAPGNPGIASLAECIPIPAADLTGLQALATGRAVDLTIVGPEAPLAAGIVDRFRAAGLAIFGPTRAAAEIETSKAFAKQLMRDAGVPTARAEVHTDRDSARDAIRRFGAPVVVKASGLASGKGVIVCHTLAEAERAVDDMLQDHRFGDAGAEVLVEEFMDGEEVSLFAITNGRSFVVLPGLQDHKRLLDGDRGPNTGGMGAYTPVSLAGPIAQAVLAPTLRALAGCGRPFTGLLYAGLMVTDAGLKVVEFNCRLGDPETQALLPLLHAQPSLLEMMLAAATGDDLTSMTAGLAEGACVTTVIAAAGYPDAPRTGDRITLPPLPDDGSVIVFHAGTALDAEGHLVSAGGRVLAVSATSSSVAVAHAKSLHYAQRVGLEGKQLRTDIGWREVARAAGSS